MAKFNVFKNKKGSLVISSDDFVYDENVSPQRMTKVMEFEADGKSDFNWGMVRAILKHSEDPKQKKQAQDVADHGL